MQYYIFQNDNQPRRKSYLVTDSMELAMQHEDAVSIVIDESDPYYIAYLKDTSGKITETANYNYEHYRESNGITIDDLCDGSKQSDFLDEIYSMASMDHGDYILHDKISPMTFKFDSLSVTTKYNEDLSKRVMYLEIRPALVSTTDNDYPFCVESKRSLEDLVEYCQDKKIKSIPVSFNAARRFVETIKDQFNDEELKITKLNFINHEGWYLDCGSSKICIQRTNGHPARRITYGHSPVVTLKHDKKTYGENEKRFKSTLSRRKNKKTKETIIRPIATVINSQIEDYSLVSGYVKDLGLDINSLLILGERETNQWCRSTKHSTVSGFNYYISKIIDLVSVNESLISKVEVSKLDKVIIKRIKETSTDSIKKRLKQWKDHAIKHDYYKTIKKNKSFPASCNFSGMKIISMYDVLTSRGIDTTYVVKKPKLKKELKKLYDAVYKFDGGIFSEIIEKEYRSLTGENYE